MRVDPSAASSLEEVLRSYVEDFSDRFGVRAEFEAEGTLQRLPPRTEAEVLRIVQEALNNVRRHADATVVRVRTERSGPISRISVTDNGRGFDPSAVPPESYGLRGMRERAELVGATLDIRSRPRTGRGSPSKSRPRRHRARETGPAGHARRRPRVRALGDPPGADGARTSRSSARHRAPRRRCASRPSSGPTSC